MSKAEMAAKVEEQAAQIKRLEQALAAEQEHWSRLVGVHNAIIHMLDEIFSLRVGAKDFEGDAPLWDVTDTQSGAVLVRHEKDLAEAYRRAIREKYQAL